MTMTKLHSAIAGAVLITGVATPVVLQQQSKLRAENDALRKQTEQLAQVQPDNDQPSQTSNESETTSATQSNQLAELLRLRNENHQLREQTQQLTREVQTAQAAALRAQVKADELAEEKKRQAALSRQAEYEARIKAAVAATGGAGTPEGQATAACINNLRQMDGAKQQWALEYKKTPTDTPTLDDIKPYLNKADQSSICPAGGTYSLNVLSAEPTCSIPGHALPR